MTANPAIGWITLPGVLFLLADGALVAFIAARAGRALPVEGRHPAVRGLKFLTLFTGIVIASGWVLGAFGFLGAAGYFVLHAALAATLAARKVERVVPNALGTPASCAKPGSPPNAPGTTRSTRKPGASGITRLVEAGRALFLPKRAGALVYGAGLLLLLLLAYALLLNIASFPGTQDSQTYRLARVGYWLQEKRIALDAAGDPRLVFMPVNTELVMTWIACFFPAGYPLVGLAQYLGGLLCLLAVFELGRLAGLSRSARVAAAALLVGMPNVLLQFSSSQSDLFTAGLLASGLVFLWRSFRGRRRWDAALAGVALGLAVGAKGTVFYWVPGLLAWAALLVWRDRRALGWHLRSLAIAAALIVALGGWKYADNWHRYHNPLAPAADVARIQSNGGPGRFRKAVFVGELHAWQLFQPNSNPRLLAPLLRPLQNRLGNRVEKAAPSEGIRGMFQAIRAGYRDDYVYEDTVSFGLFASVLAALGLVLACRPRRHRFERLAIGVSLAVFFAFFFTQQYPNAWNYRFFVLLGPFLAVLGVSWLPVAGRWAGVSVLIVTLFQFGTAVDLQARNILGGWRGLAHPGEMSNLSYFRALGQQVAGLPPRVRTVAVALPVDDWLAPYFRLERGGRRVRLARFEGEPLFAGTPQNYLRASGCDAIITRPGAFARDDGAVERRGDGLPGGFARVCYLRP